MPYRHAQIGKTFIVMLAILEGLISGVLYFVHVAEGIDDLVALFFSIEAVFVLLILLFFQFVVTVEDGFLKISFGIGLVKKRWRLDEIVRVTAVRNKWWYGLGIHLTPVGWLYNLEGLGAVEIEKVDGSVFRVGTDEPNTLIREIEQSKKKTS